MENIDKNLLEAFNIRYGTFSPEAILTLTPDTIKGMSDEDFDIFEKLFSELMKEQGEDIDDSSFIHINTNKEGYPVYTKELDI